MSERSTSELRPAPSVNEVRLLYHFYNSAFKAVTYLLLFLSSNWTYFQMFTDFCFYFHQKKINIHIYDYTALNGASRYMHFACDATFFHNSNLP